MHRRQFIGGIVAATAAAALPGAPDEGLVRIVVPIRDGLYACAIYRNGRHIASREGTISEILTDGHV